MRLLNSQPKLSIATVGAAFTSKWRLTNHRRHEPPPAAFRKLPMASFAGKPIRSTLRRSTKAYLQFCKWLWVALQQASRMVNPILRPQSYGRTCYASKAAPVLKKQLKLYPVLLPVRKWRKGCRSHNQFWR